MEVQVTEGYYVREKYATLTRFVTYFYQIDAVRRLKPKSVLFVGVGDGLVPYFLKQAGFEVTTLDFDVSLRPDIVGDVRKIPCPDKSFDMVCVFEVLEHMPFDESKQALKEMARVARESAVVAVPHRRTGVEVVFKFPGIRSLLGRDFVRLALRVPIRFKGFAFSGQHYWEIDGRSTTLASFRQALNEHFTIVREETPVLDMYRRFFALKVRT